MATPATRSSQVRSPSSVQATFWQLRPLEHDDRSLQQTSVTGAFRVVGEIGFSGLGGDCIRFSESSRFALHGP